MSKDYEIRTVKVCVAPKNEPLFSEMATTIEITDEAGGEYVEVCQSHTEAKILIIPEEWPTLKHAIEMMMKECRDNGVQK